jgi:FkbH-like protein
MSDLHTRLRWLPPPPEDFAHRVKHLGGGRDVRFLAQHALDLNQLTRLARAIGRMRGEMRAGVARLHPLAPCRLAILSSFNMDLIVPALVASAARHGIALEVVQPAYDQVMQEALVPDSALHGCRPDVVLLALDHRGLPLVPSPGDAGRAEATIRETVGQVQAIRSAIRTHSGAACIVSTLPRPVEPLFGSLDRILPGTRRHLIDSVNRELCASIEGSGDVLLDAAALAETVGLDRWHDPRLWNMARLAFCDDCIPLYADHVARTLAALRGKSRRVLILDLDNTLWGGVIGDDGLEGIQLAQGDAQGEAYRQVQAFALELRQRGVLIAISSKNRDEVARAPFLRHPEMLLKLEHIAVFQANWQDKASNIVAVAEALSLGLDAMVFLDDNPAERDLVRRLLPEVAVVELPDEAALFARTLAASGYFEAVSLSAEDLGRAKFYQENAARAELRRAVDGLDAYLEALDMTISFTPFDAISRARIVQLINKSNQYNLTARRYTEAEIRQAGEDPDVFTLQVRLADRFGDNGMISAVLCRMASAGTWRIDTWVMSCRVLGRRVECMVLRELLKHAQGRGIHTLTGTYRPTGRNQLVSDHFARLGFTKTSEEGDGTTHWALSCESAQPQGAPMRVVSSGFG